MASSLRRIVSAPLMAFALAPALLLGTQTQSAAAAVNQYWSPTVYTGQGGSAQTRVIADTSRHSISIRSWVTQNNGGPQGLRACVYILQNNVWVPLPCRVATSQYSGNCAATCIFDEAAVIAPGWYKVSVWYGWLTQGGWAYPRLGEVVGWILV